MSTPTTTRIRAPLPDAEALAELCRRWQIIELAVFGSALRDDFRPDSDIDVLVSFGPDARWTLFGLVDLRDELSALFGRPVDLVQRTAVERSRNPYRRKAILDSAEPLHVTG